MTVQVPSRLSWSAVSSYAECGERFRLERLFKVPKHSWWSTIAGTAIHEITEFIDRAVFAGLDLEDAADMAPTFAAVFDRIAADPREVPELGLKASQKRGMKTITEQGGPNGKDHDWWLHWGPIYVQRYVRWRGARGWEIAVMPDGRPGIELGFRFEIDGMPVLGIIDRVFYDPETESIILLDIKSGKEPAGSLQLISYVMGLLAIYGLRVRYACYWMPSSPAYYKGTEGENVGRQSMLIDVDDWSMERIEQMYRNANRGIRAGVFLPQVTSMCSGCTVRDYCFAVAGDKHAEIPVGTEMVDRASGEVVDGVGSSTSERGSVAQGSPMAQEGESPYREEAQRGQS